MSNHNHTGSTISTDTIRCFRLEALAAGDDAAVAIADAALDRSIPTRHMMDARQRVADMINDANDAKEAV